MIKNRNNKLTNKKRQNHFEKWHIFRGWKHGCKVCDECDHHSHLYCKTCKKVANGIYKRCECDKNLYTKNNTYR